jgi:cell division cycle protein 37
MESAVGIDAKADQPPPRPAGVHGSEEPLPTYTKMMATLLDQVNKALDEKKVESSQRYAAMTAEIEDHLNKVQSLQKDLLAKLAELEKEEGRKITSDSIHTGFDSSHVNKAKPGAAESTVELLNPNFSASESSSSAEPKAKATADNEDAEITASPDAIAFSKIDSSDYRGMLNFISSHPGIRGEKQEDGLLALAFDAQLSGDEELAQRCVHHSVLLQYCRMLGKDGTALFFKRMTTPGHQSQGMFAKQVAEMYTQIRNRTKAIKDAKEGEVEQIQLHAVEPGTVINIKIPSADAEEESEKKGREIFESFGKDLRAALETGSLDEVNKVLGNMPVAEAEDVVAKLGEVSFAQSSTVWEPPLAN